MLDSAWYSRGRDSDRRAVTSRSSYSEWPPCRGASANRLSASRKGVMVLVARRDSTAIRCDEAGLGRTMDSLARSGRRLRSGGSSSLAHHIHGHERAVTVTTRDLLRRGECDKSV